MMLKNIRKQIAFHGRQMLINGLAHGTSGNISVRDEKSGLIAITPSSLPYSIVSPEDIVVMNIEGSVVNGKCRPSSEWQMHTEIYKSMPKVMSIVHTHSPFASACAASGGRIPLVTAGICLHCQAPISAQPFRLPGTEAVGESALLGLTKGNYITLLQNHGVVTVGTNLWYAFDAACAIEEAAQIMHNSISFGGALTIPPDARRELYSRNPLNK